MCICAQIHARCLREMPDEMNQPMEANSPTIGLSIVIFERTDVSRPCRKRWFL
jgi:hypothetical protein